MKLKLILLLICVPFFLMAQTEWYAGPNGTASNNGTKESPWDLQTALTDGNDVKAGDTIWLLDGQYDGRFRSTIKGTATSPITVASYPDEWAVLNGNVVSTEGSVLSVTGGYVHFKDFEITHIGDFTRNKADANFSIGNGIFHTAGEDCKFINLVIHDNPGSGIGSWKFTAGTEIYGNVIYNNGWVEPTGRYLHGVGLYVQNISDDKRRLLENNIIYNQFYKGIEIWSACSGGNSGSDDSDASDNTNDTVCGDYVKNIDAIRNTVFNSSDVDLTPFPDAHNDNIFVGTGDEAGVAIARNINILNNVTYHNTDFTWDGTLTDSPTLTIGHTLAAPVENVVVRNNMLIGRNNALRFFSANTLTYENNISWGRYNLIKEGVIASGSTNNWSFSDNKYFTRYNSQTRLDQGVFRRDDFNKNIPSTADRNLTKWQNDTGLDLGSTWNVAGVKDLTRYNPFSENNFVEITSNKYDPNKFKVVTLNIGQNTITADFSTYSEAEEGITYTLRDVENYDTIIETGIISASKQIEIPTGLTAFNAPLGTGFTDGSSKTIANFGVFIIEFDSVESKCENQTTWDGADWDNGEPNNTVKAIIDGNYAVNQNTIFEACSLTINDGANFTIQENASAIIQNDVVNNSYDKSGAPRFIIKDTGSLVMIEDDGIVTGRITVNKKWGDYLFDSDPAGSDRYSLWGTPVSETESVISSVFSSKATTLFWNTFGTTNTFNFLPSTASLKPGVGYYVAQNDATDFEEDVARIFTGTVNTGDIEVQVNYNPGDDNAHFFGNPYPSAIDWFQFREDNREVLEGTIYFWKQTTPTIPGTQDPSQFVSLNSVGIVPIDANDTNREDLSFITTGLGFSVDMKASAPEGSVVVFKNSQRVANKNNQVLRTSGDRNANKIWLNLRNDLVRAQLLLGFSPECTVGFDSDCDARFLDAGAVIEFYSLLEDQKLTIQGKPSLETLEESIPLGFKVVQDGTYTFDIEQEFIDNTREIILEDTVEGTFTNLRETSYSFTSEAGEFNSRFVLQFNVANDPTVVSDFDYERPCDSFGFDLDFNFLGGTEDATFFWSFGANATPQTSTEQNPMGIKFSEEGDYDVSLEVTKGRTTVSSTQTLTVENIGSTGRNRILVCRNGKTRNIQPRQLKRYLNLGYCIGVCDGDKKVEICKNNRTRIVKMKNLQVNLNRGATLGACDSDERAVVCYNGRTKIIKRKRLERYLAYGYQLGICKNNYFVEPSENEETLIIDNDLKLYPNPTAGNLNIKITISEDYNSLKVIDISGRVILVKPITNEKTVKLDVSNLSKGMYYISIQSNDEQVLTKKFIKL